MKPKLQQKIEEPGFGKGALDIDTGIMAYYGHAFTYVSVQYLNHYKLYLSVFDDWTPDDLLIETEADTLQEAKMLAELELKSLLNSNIH